MWEWKQANSSLLLLRTRLARYNLPWLPACRADVDRDARDWFPATQKFNVLVHKRKSLYYSVVREPRGGQRNCTTAWYVKRGCGKVTVLQCGT